MIDLNCLTEVLNGYLHSPVPCLTVLQPFTKPWLLIVVPILRDRKAGKTILD